MRSQAILFFLAASASVTVFGSPILRARGTISPDVKCASTDKTGSPLVGSSVVTDGGFAECDYQEAGACQYFAADGNFGSGSSDCPAGIAQDSTFGQSQTTTSKIAQVKQTTAAPPETTTTKVIKETTKAAAPPETTTTKVIKETTKAAPPPPPKTVAPPPPMTTSMMIHQTHAAAPPPPPPARPPPMSSAPPPPPPMSSAPAPPPPTSSAALPPPPPVSAVAPAPSAIASPPLPITGSLAPLPVPSPNPSDPAAPGVNNNPGAASAPAISANPMSFVPAPSISAASAVKSGVSAADNTNAAGANTAPAALVLGTMIALVGGILGLF